MPQRRRAHPPFPSPHLFRQLQDTPEDTFFHPITQLDPRHASPSPLRCLAPPPRLATSQPPRLAPVPQVHFHVCTLRTHCGGRRGPTAPIALCWFMVLAVRLCNITNFCICTSSHLMVMMVCFLSCCEESFNAGGGGHALEGAYMGEKMLTLLL